MSEHALLEKDPDEMVGVCASCGPVDLYKDGTSSGGTPQFRCAPRARERRKEQYQRESTYESRRDQRLRWWYDVSLEEYEALLAKQNGECLICKKPPEDCQHGVLVLDHDHDTGEIRGLLCDSCNRGLGHFGDDLSLLQQAVEYLKGEL